MTDLKFPDDMPATPGAQRQIDQIRKRVHDALVAAIVVVILVGFGLGITGWQISRAFDKINGERSARVGALASINTFLCQRIDRVGNGVAALVAVELEQSPPPEGLNAKQQKALAAFQSYVTEQERPPRCKELARKVATLTGADPGDIVITPIHLHSRNPAELPQKP